MNYALTFSISRRIYGTLLHLYPTAYVRSHGAELLQNFEDLEQDASSVSALWVFIIFDLIKSVPIQYMEYLKNSPRARLALGVIVVLFLALLIMAIAQVKSLEVAHSSFDHYAAFRGCATITSHTDTTGTCTTTSGATVKIVKYDDRWFLDGDLPQCALKISNHCFANWP